MVIASKFLFAGILLVVSSIVNAQSTEKQSLDHSVFEDWNTLSDVQLSRLGNFTTFEINPQKGDGHLFVYHRETEVFDTIARGDKAQITWDERYVVCLVQPCDDSVRQAKMDDVKKAKRPKDSLLVHALEGDRQIRKARVKNYQLPDKNGGWLALLLEDSLEASDEDTTAAETEEDAIPLPKQSKSDNEEEDPGNTLLLVALDSLTLDTIPFVKTYLFDEKGNHLVLHIAGDSTRSDGIYRYDLGEEKLRPLKTVKGEYKQLATDKAGKQIAFVHSNDTTDDKAYQLYRWDANMDSAQLVIDSSHHAVPGGWTISPNGNVTFSESGERLLFGMHPFPEPVDSFFDTVPEFEQPKLDVWSHHDADLQPYQKENLEKERKRSYTSVYHIKDESVIRLENDTIRHYKINAKQDGRYALGWSDRPYRKARSWDYPWQRDYYLYDLKRNEKMLVVKGASYGARLSPAGDYVIWYDVNPRQWKVYDIDKQSSRTLTDQLSLPWHEVEDDHPMEARPYGMEGVTKKDEWIFINSRYDIWAFDPDGKKDPWCVTGGQGAEEEIDFNYLKLDKEAEAIDLSVPLYFRGFNEADKSSGFYRMEKKGLLETLVAGNFKYRSLSKAKDAQTFTYRKERFEAYPEVYLTNDQFDNPTKLSTTNPQQSNYRWGSVELTSWLNMNGDTLQGLIYKPYDFDTAKQYPMLVYFYEKVSDRLHDHRIPSPSRSTINPSFYTSRGYVVFMPDITYKVGSPGRSAYNAIMSGTMHMLEQGYVDRQRMGLQGQSWGGYQTAYMVTQTDLFAAAMAGAPVSNMTSAYGGIRWGSGLSRMFQYEKTQSRLGATLWENPYRYIENSPLFYANRVNTPLLMMHNDGDGAVPWYQGIEFFVALRRLGNPTWMLVYNDEEHNLRKWPNRKDLSKRMQQFFDHYLKDKPAPMWMTEGIPATRKGKETGYGHD